MTDKGTAYLFIDDAHIESLEDAAKGVVPAEKVSDQPLIEKDKPWEEEWRIGSYINVIYDDEEDLFKMWYGVGRKLSDARGEEADGFAYAISQDGYHWEKPVLNLVEDSGSKANNLVFPAKRYKMLFMFQSQSMRFAGIVQPVCVAYSSDGIHWNVPQGLAQSSHSRGIGHAIGRLLGSKSPQIRCLPARQAQRPDHLYV